MTNFYETYFIRYLESDIETREKTKQYWIEKHQENIKADRNDLIIFSAQIIAMIVLAEHAIKNNTVNSAITNCLLNSIRG